jgi:hypothetical protein
MASKGVASSSERAVLGLGSKMVLRRKCLHELAAVQFDLAVDEDAVDEIEQVVGMPALQHALELVREHLLERHDLERGGAVGEVGVGVDQRSMLNGQQDAVVLGDVDAHLQRDVIGAAGEALKVEPQLVDGPRAVDLVLVGKQVAVGVEIHAAHVLRPAADVVELLDQLFAVESAAGREVEVVGEACARQVGLAKGVPALQSELLSAARLAEQAREQPPEDVVALHVGGVQVELFGFAFDLAAVDHAPSDARCCASAASAAEQTPSATSTSESGSNQPAR